MNKEVAEAQANLLTYRWPQLTTEVVGGPRVFSIDITFPGRRRLRMMSEADRCGVVDICQELFSKTYRRPACEMSQEEAETLNSSAVEA